MASPPKHIRSLTDEQALEIEWNDGRKFLLPFRFLREQCPCAMCVNEFTGQRILDVTTIPDDIHPTNIRFSGNYAIKIAWSDNHDTGLFTWEHLTNLTQNSTTNDA